MEGSSPAIVFIEASDGLLVNLAMVTTIEGFTTDNIKIHLSDGQKIDLQADDTLALKALLVGIGEFEPL